MNKSKFNSSTERIFGNSQKMIGINTKNIFMNMNKEPQSSINRNVNVNMNLNKNKIPMPIKNGYNMNPKINKINKIKISK